MYPHYFNHVDAIIFVIDANDRDRIPESISEFCNMLLDDRLIDKPVLILLNKQDLPNAISSDDFCFQFDINKKMGEREWIVQHTTAVYPLNGVYEGVEWLSSVLLNKRRIKKFDNKYQKLLEVWGKRWIPENHNYFPISFRKIVWSLILISLRVNHIPIEIIQHILSYFSVSRLVKGFYEIKELGKGLIKKI